MSNLNDELADAQREIQGVKNLLREEVPNLFDFDVVVGNVNYNDTKNTASVTVEPSSEARGQVSEQLGGVKVQIDGTMEFEFGFASEEEESRR
ncbi:MULTISPECIES: hypothetical protein [Halorussus]|uniref:hypothetical protein n=1 Tax=Halorussus TaxID=1070314 RepID=UPI00209EB146|nr:hypothetical protein [Halorussus vallis]USZ76598.1 hypothetical protein NGM07_04540 [Halorussus vallis]